MFSEKDFLENGTIFQIGVTPRRIDSIPSITSVEFYEAYNDSLAVEIDGFTIPVLSLETLIKKKKPQEEKKTH